MKKSQASLPTNFAVLVAQWFSAHARDLPWRKTTDPYKIWVSEIMLQQTTVATVIPYYERFIKRFPRVEDLAKSPEVQVLKFWEGLGYYSRARNLHRASQMVVNDFGGKIPESRDQILQLPGIGAYSAGSILSIAFRKSEAALDGNLIRVYSRLLGIKKPVDESAVLRRLWGVARSQVPSDVLIIREFTEGMMELGALVCTPKNPQCSQCPVAQFCRANEKGIQSEIPIKNKRMNRKKLRETVFVRRRGDHWGFLEKGADPKFPHFQRLPFRSLKIDSRVPKHFTFKTKYSVTDRDFEVFVVVGTAIRKDAKMVWVPTEELSNILLPAVDRKILRHLQDYSSVCKFKK